MDLLAAIGDQRRARFSVRPRPPAPLPDIGPLLAGVSEVDITPPPGMPKAGYSTNAHTSDGFRTRLRARVLHMRAGATSLALVQCDLLGGSSVLHHLVADAVADRTDVPLAGLMLGATHTHAGPGQYLGSDFYNGFASNKKGFDPEFTELLVRRIAGGVIEAVEGRRPATLAVGQVEVWGLTRNRSLPPHVHNESVADKRTEPQRKFAAINPALRLIRVDTGDAPLAAVVVFSVHGTGISMHTDETNADVWAYLCGELGDAVARRHGVRPVVGAINGTHADVAPAIRPGAAGHLEAARVGRAIGAEAAALFESLEPELTDRVTLGFGLREIDLDTDRSIAGITLPARPAAGAALIAGAQENLTPWVSHLPPFAAGRPRRWGRPGPHGPKWVMGTRWVHGWLYPNRVFPRVLPVQVLRLGDTLLVGLPFELTVETGRRIAAAVAGDAGVPVEDVVISSVANEYAGYVTTPEEYDLQWYEGGHTLYGPKSQPFLAAHAGRLAASVRRDGHVHDVPAERRWDMRIGRYLPRASGLRSRRGFVGAAAYRDPSLRLDGYWELEWRDAGPGDLAFHEPLVRVEAEAADGGWVPAVRHGRVVDDQGWDLQVAYLGDGRYRVRWWDPELGTGRRHRFVLCANSGQPEVASDTFD